ncbi:MAG: hypothetical protein LBQ65_10555 [Tannerellaceae bacterium]|jgi:hypothetical protein|nr:hypothetical protein [Tannerellaceae bacterium]
MDDFGKLSLGVLSGLIALVLGLFILGARLFLLLLDMDMDVEKQDCRETKEIKEEIIEMLYGFVGLEVFVLWGFFAFLDIGKPFGVSLLATGLLVAVSAILRQLARLLFRSFLILTGQEWKSSNQAWALAGIRKISQQDMLKDAALKSSFGVVRREAVLKITDQDFLKDIALKDVDRDVCRAAWEKITDFDQEYLKEVVLKASDRYVCEAAIDILLKESVDETLFKALISTLAKRLKTSGNTSERRDCAQYLQTIYNRHPSSSFSDDIRKLNGTMIYGGHAHADNRKPEHSDQWSEYCRDVCSGYEEHYDHRDHSDYPPHAAVYFNVEESV